MAGWKPLSALSLACGSPTSPNSGRPPNLPSLRPPTSPPPPPSRLPVIEAAGGVGGEVERIIASHVDRRHRLILVLNKIDLVRKPELLGLSAGLCERLTPDKVFMISATQGEGVAYLKQALAETMPS